MDPPFVEIEISISQDTAPTVIGASIKKGLVTAPELALTTGQQHFSIALHRFE